MSRVIRSFSIVVFFAVVSSAQSTRRSFPIVSVPGAEAITESLGALQKLHYPGTGPKSTLWDAWLPEPCLWPSTPEADGMRAAWKSALRARTITEDGYVATHLHPSIAHPLGWPFPFWNQGKKVFGRHFSFKDTVGPPWRKEGLDRPDGIFLDGARDGGVDQDGWAIEFLRESVTVEFPVVALDPFESPFLQWRFSASPGAFERASIEWRRSDDAEYSPTRRSPSSSGTSDGLNTVLFSMFGHAQWTGEIRSLRIVFENAKIGAVIRLHSVFSQYDTRQNVNGADFVRGAAVYFLWTGDHEFLRDILPRMRLAIDHIAKEHGAKSEKIVHTRWVGHDGRSGVFYDESGRKSVRAGFGIGNNYWDLMPFGGEDAYATVHYEDALRHLVRVEESIARHPEWAIPSGQGEYSATALVREADAVRAEANRRFFSKKTGRFVGSIDSEGVAHDYGFTFLNLEAVASGLATEEHAKSIMAWIGGERTVDGDTSQGKDIYFFRFGPRATTRRNIDWYVWAWSGPESIPFGGQVQDGGAVLGFSYHDLAARLRVFGPDDVLARLTEIARWFDDVRAAGGYRRYYDGKRPGHLQGGGTAGGLGMDHEFFESALLPEIMIDGFLGLRADGDGFTLLPRLPTTWPEMSIDGVLIAGSEWEIRVARNEILLRSTGRRAAALRVRLPSGFVALDDPLESRPQKTANGDDSFEIPPGPPRAFRFGR